MQFICVQSVHVCSGKKLSSDLYGNFLAQGPTFYLTPILHVISFHGRGSYSCMFFSKLYNNLLDFVQKKAHSCKALLKCFYHTKMGCGKSPPPPILWPSLEARLVFGVQLCQHGKKKIPIWGRLYSIKFCSTVSVSSQLMWNCYIHYSCCCCCCCCYGFLGVTTNELFSLF